MGEKAWLRCHPEAAEGIATVEHGGVIEGETMRMMKYWLLFSND